MRLAFIFLLFALPMFAQEAKKPEVKADPVPTVSDKDRAAILSAENKMLSLQHQFDQIQEQENTLKTQAQQEQAELTQLVSKAQSLADNKKWVLCSLLSWGIYPRCAAETDVQFLPAPQAATPPKPEEKK